MRNVVSNILRNMNTFAPAVIITLLLNTFPEIECSIRCYKCLAARPFYYTDETVLLCENFDYSDKFIVDCPYSTFCMKTLTSAKISGVINGTDRDCANQKQVIQKYYDRDWHKEIHVEYPYQPGCTVVDDKGARTSSIEHCYCNSDLCNSSEMNIHSTIFLVILAVITFLI
ncbi:uncharacterized protein isoform X1 [Leptinotarsa decemlineata]|uniref:uncharacterized protein isoform X1 n=1 Tax=Leptinotarsa decemlineata TaxID=7539 RepID=UPI003D308FAF